MALFGGTGYPTLIRVAEKVSSHRTELEVKRIDREEAEKEREVLVEIYGEGSWAEFFIASCDESGFDHYFALDQGRPVSAANLCSTERVGYLGWAATIGSHRGRGGQSALIAERIDRAGERGCRWVCAETLYMLETSLNNLKRFGFEILYEKKIFVWERKT